MALKAQLKLEARCFLELYLFPSLAAWLPWPLAYRLLRRIARWRKLFSPEWQGALHVAKQYLPIDDEDDWGWRFRTNKLVDHADYWSSRFRTRRWLTRHVDVIGEWPCTKQAAVGMFFHWCPGMWAARALHVAGPSHAVLAGRFSRKSMGGSFLAYWYGHLRLAELARNAGRPLVYAPGTLKRAADELAAGNWVTGTPDVPPDETRLAASVRVFDRSARLPEGLLTIARRAGVPVVVYTLALDFATGRRQLRIFGRFDANDPELLQQIANRWEGLLREASWGFFLWTMFPAYFHEGG